MSAIFDNSPSGLRRQMIESASREVRKAIDAGQMTMPPVDLADATREAVQAFAKLPPPIAGIRTSHHVPYGRTFRQWDTRGRLWVWVNRGEVEDLPRGPRPTPGGVNVVAYDFNAIPIYNE